MRTLIIIGSLITLMACNTSVDRSKSTETMPVVDRPQVDTIRIVEPEPVEEEVVDIYSLHDKYLPIVDSLVRWGRMNDSLGLWTDTIHVAMPELSKTTEGDDFVIHRQDSFERIVYTQAFETGRNEYEFYLFKDTLQLFVSMEYTYHRPIYWDSAMAAENNDSFVFGQVPHELQVEDNYFEGQHIVYQVSDDFEFMSSKEYILQVERKALALLEKIRSHLYTVDQSTAD